SGDRRIGQHGKHGLESTAGHEDELDLRMRAEKLVQALTVVWFTCEQGAIEIRGQEHALFSLRKAGCAAVRRLPVQARMASGRDRRESADRFGVLRLLRPASASIAAKAIGCAARTGTMAWGQCPPSRRERGVCANPFRHAAGSGDESVVAAR